MTGVTLWDWRRRIADLYAQVRANPDPLAAWLHWRAVRDTLFQSHPQTPLDHPAHAAGQPDVLPFFDYDPAHRYLVELRPAAGDGLSLPAGGDGEVRLSPYARTHGLQATLGAELTLFWIQGYGGGVFLPFADATNGLATDGPAPGSRHTYGGGRYLLDTIKGADLGLSDDGRAVLDFNFAYNPSCAYSPRWTCPLSPRQNRLPVAVRAGERMRPDG